MRQRYIDEEKMSPKEATQQAMRDVRGPVITHVLDSYGHPVLVGFIPYRGGSTSTTYAAR
jgi:HAE1 family hydrophobic/amphiphilic exporter-1